MDNVTYTKKDIIRKVSNNLNVSKDEVQIIFESILTTISDIICKEEYLSRIEVRNFGVFEVKSTKAKPKARNPKTNEEIYVPPRRKVHYKPGKIIKNILNKDRS
tara:strand:+ start:1467 stop:1778 length:312 start_codon:yes stop_codon:yes gene_type:complete